MLKLAYQCQDALNKAWQECVFQEKYQFYNYGNWWEYSIKLDEGSLDKIQMVSVDRSGNVLGYLSVCVDRLSNKVSNVGAINFGNVNAVFARDLFQFLSDLFTKHGFRKIEWFVVVGNPAEKMYDKIIKRYGGRVIGIRRESVITFDGALRDEKEYELFKRDYDSRCFRKLEENVNSQALGNLEDDKEE